MRMSARRYWGKWGGAGKGAGAAQIKQQLADQSYRCIANARKSEAHSRQEAKARLDVLCDFWECLHTDNDLCARSHLLANGCHQSAEFPAKKSKSDACDTGSV